MKNLCFGFEQQNLPFNFYTMDLKPDESFSFSTKTNFNDKKTFLRTKYVLNKAADEKDSSLTPKAEIFLDQKLGERMNTILMTNPSETSAKFFIKLLNKEKHKLNFLPMYKTTKAQNGDDKSLFNIVLNYNFSNKIMTSLGLENLSQESSYIPTMYSFSYIQGKELSNEKIINGGLRIKYNPKLQATQFINLFASLRNPHFNSLLAFDLTKNTEVEGSNSESEKLGFEKMVALKMCNKFNEKWSCGGESTLSFSSKKISTKLYAKCQVDPETTLKAQWDDKDKSVTFGFSHLFRKIFKTGLSYKIIPDETKASKKIGFGLKTKFGFSAEIQDTQN